MSPSHTYSGEMVSRIETHQPCHECRQSSAKPLAFVGVEIYREEQGC